MQKKMVFQICLLAESPMAHVTLKWPGSGVHVRVRFEIAWSWKGFGTHCAFVWFFLKKCKERETLFKGIMFLFSI